MGRGIVRGGKNEFKGDRVGSPEEIDDSSVDDTTKIPDGRKSQCFE